MSKKKTWIFDAVEKHKKKKLEPVGLETVTAIGNKLVEKKKSRSRRGKIKRTQSWNKRDWRKRTTRCYASL